MADPSSHRHLRRGADSTDALIEALAAAHGWVTDDCELRAAGVHRNAVRRRVDSGRLRELWPGTYGLGSRPPTWQGHFRAAARSCGPGAAACLRCAGIARGLLLGEPARIDVLSTSRVPGRDGIRRHSCRYPLGDDLEEVDGIPVTSLARTAIDLAAAGARRDLERMLRAAEDQHLDAAAVVAISEERRPGAPLLRVVLADLVPDGTTASDFEEEFHEWLRAGGPRGGVHNHPIVANGRRYVLDVHWPQARLAVELDPFSSHGDQRAFERDRRKDADLLVEGIAVVRITPTRLRRDGAEVRRTLRRLIADRSVERAPRLPGRWLDG